MKESGWYSVSIQPVFFKCLRMKWADADSPAPSLPSSAVSSSSEKSAPTIIPLKLKISMDTRSDLLMVISCLKAFLSTNSAST